VKIPVRAIQLKEVLPSSLLICSIGLGAFWLWPSWTFFGQLSVWVWPLGVVLGLLIYLVSFAITRSKLLMTRSMREILQNLHIMFRAFSWSKILLISLLAGVGEELLMRGLLQTWLSSQIGIWPAIVVTAIVFGALHFMNFTYMLLTFFIGLLFGLLFYLSNSMLLVMLAHTVYDVCAFTMIVKYPHMLGLQYKDE